LAPFADADFVPIVAARFPGLSTENIDRVVSTCRGNVLRLIERLAALEREPRFFVGQSLLNDLSAAGIRNIEQRWRD
jgi:hypothetical protein